MDAWRAESPKLILAVRERNIGHCRRSVGVWRWECHWIGSPGVEAYIPGKIIRLAWDIVLEDSVADETILLLYQIVGSMTIAWGFVIYLYLPDGPHNAKMLTEYERVVAVWRISRNQTGLKEPKIVPAQIKEALLDPRQWLLYLMAICYGILNGGVANFLAAIIKGFGYSALHTSMLQTPVGALELVMVIAFGYLSKVPNMLGATIISKYLPAHIHSGS